MQRVAGLVLVLVLGSGLWASLPAEDVSAHIVYGTKTLHGFVSESDLVVRARIVAVDPLPVADTTIDPEAEGKPTGDARPGVDALVIEVLKGSWVAPRVRFAQHGHGVARFEPGSEVLLFLVDVAKSRELDVLARQGRFRWLSVQEHQDEYPLTPRTRDALRTAVAGYVVADAAIHEDVKLEHLRLANLALLTSGDAELASSALRELVLAGDDRLLTADEVPALMAVMDDPRASMGVRAGLLTELARRRLVDPGPVWLRLLSDAVPARDRITAIRAAGVSGMAHEAVRARLVALVASPDDRVAAEAALALGVPGNDEAVATLQAALGRDSVSVRNASIRALGRIGTPEAMAVLEAAAEGHPDPSTRRRAEAEGRKRQGG